MLVYLDTNIVIYAVENPPVFGAKAAARLRAISVSDQIALSELTRTECCSYPLAKADFALFRSFLRDGFSSVQMLPSCLLQATCFCRNRY